MAWQEKYYGKNGIVRAERKGHWTNADKEAAWSKAHPIRGYDPDQVRTDTCGTVLVRDLYGVKHPNGWVVDHKVPLAAGVQAGGTNHPSNLQALQWETNLTKHATLDTRNAWCPWGCRR